jgi:type II secretory ATPase GspE/PulE/Tfp pilus assembly ATPase PilB-like protein
MGTEQQRATSTEPVSKKVDSAVDGEAAALVLDVKDKEPDEAVPMVIEHAARIHASDVFLNSEPDGVDVAFRHLGIVRPIARLPADLGRRCISFIKTMANMNLSERRRPTEGRWLFQNGSDLTLDLRIGVLPTLHGEDCTLRVLDRGHRLLLTSQLGMDKALHDQLLLMLSSPSGLVLVAGPTETGKSTTLYACLSYLNNGQRKIITIEDPVEYTIKGLRQAQVNEAIGLRSDELLRNVLRQSPDVIMIGEIRDVETANTAVRAAGSGHLVLSTLHAPVAAAAVHSLIRLGVHPHLLSSSLLAVISQRLVRTLCPRCKKSFPTPSSHIFDDVRQFLKPGEGEQLWSPQGCAECYMTGYAGRTAVFEMLRVTPAVRDLIDHQATAAVVRQKAVEEGMIEFRQSAMLKVARGETSIEEVIRVLPAEYLEAAVAR